MLIHDYIFLRWPEERVGGEAGRVAPHRPVKAMVWIFAFKVCGVLSGMMGGGGGVGINRNIFTFCV